MFGKLHLKKKKTSNSRTAQKFSELAAAREKSKVHNDVALKKLIGNDKPSTVRRKKQKKEAPFAPNSYVHLRDNPYKKTNKKKISKLFRTFTRNLYRRKFYILLFFLLLSLPGWIYLALNVDYFRIKSFEVINAESLDEKLLTAVNTDMNQYINQNIFNTSTFNISNELESKNIHIKEAYIRKILPDKLEIEIIPADTSVAIASFHGVTILGPEYEIVGKDTTNTLKLNDYENDILLDVADFNAEYVREKYLISIEDPEERKAVVWQDVPEEKKREVLNKMKDDLNLKVETFEDQIKALVEKKYQVPVIFMYSLSEEEFSQSIIPDQILRRVEFSRVILKELEAENLKSIEIKWISNFTISFTLENSAQLLFLIERSVEDQIKDLNTVLGNYTIEEARIYDFRTATFSIQ